MDTLQSVNLEAIRRSDRAKERYRQNYRLLRDEGFTYRQADVMAHWSRLRIDNAIKEMRMDKGKVEDDAGESDGQT